MKAIHLRTEYLENPLGLGISSPRFYWHCEGGEKQTAYQIIAKVDNEIVWDSGRVESSSMTHIPYEGRELTEAGEAETAYKVLLNTEKPGWLYEVIQGATTVWETWEGYVGKGAVDKGDAGSLNHYSPGAVCQWLFDTVCGIRPDGENKFLLAPIPGGTLTHARASCQSLYGKVECGWEKTESGTRYTASLPAGHHRAAVAARR